MNFVSLSEISSHRENLLFRAAWLVVLLCRVHRLSRRQSEYQRRCTKRLKHKGHYLPYGREQLNPPANPYRVNGMCSNHNSNPIRGQGHRGTSSNCLKGSHDRTTAEPCRFRIDRQIPVPEAKMGGHDLTP